MMKRQEKVRKPIDYIEFTFTKPTLLRRILSDYLEGYTLEEIHWRLSLSRFRVSIEDIDELLDYIIQSNY